MIGTPKYCLYPYARQARKLNDLLHLSRNVYNAALEQRITVYRETGKGITHTAQSQHFGTLRDADPDGLDKLNFSSMQSTLRRLEKAFGAFFRRVKADETPGFPRFKSIEFTHGDGGKLRFDDNRRAGLYVQNVGEIKLKHHRRIPDDAKIKRVIVKCGVGEVVCLIPD